MGARNIAYWESKKETMISEAAKWREEQKGKRISQREKAQQKKLDTKGLYTPPLMWKSAEEELLEHSICGAKVESSSDNIYAKGSDCFFQETRHRCQARNKEECMHYKDLIGGNFGCWNICNCGVEETRCMICFRWYVRKRRHEDRLEIGRIYGWKWGDGLSACPDCEQRLQILMRENGFFFCRTCLNWHNYEIPQYSQCKFEKETEYRKPLEMRTPREMPLDPAQYSLDKMPSDNSQIIWNNGLLSTNIEIADFCLEEERVS